MPRCLHSSQLPEREYRDIPDRLLQVLQLHNRTTLRLPDSFHVRILESRSSFWDFHRASTSKREPSSFPSFPLVHLQRAATRSHPFRKFHINISAINRAAPDFLE